VPVAPVPVPPEVTESHVALDVAVQPQLPPLVEIDTLPVPPTAAKVAVAGESAVTAHAAAAWVIGIVTFIAFPLATVIVAERGAAVGFAEAVKVNEPSPVPDAAESTSHD